MRRPLIKLCYYCGLKLPSDGLCRQPQCIAEREFIANKPDEGDPFAGWDEHGGEK